MVLIKKIYIFFAFLLLTLFTASCQKPQYSSETFLMDTVVTQTVIGTSAESTVKKAEEIIKNLENTYSAYIETSLTNTINSKSGISPVKVNDEELNLIKRCVEFSDSSDGLFDLTIAPLTKLWNINGENPKVPKKEEIEKAKSLINYKDVSINEEENTVFLKNKDMQLDFGATVKGYASQKILELYKQENIQGAVLSLGGNITVFGEKSDGSPFKIGIRDPKKSSADYFAILKTEGKIIATSGAYERYFKEEDIIYHHILNPETGYPCDSDLQSVTVISEDGLLSDYLSTLFYMLGKDAVKENLTHDNFSLIAIDKEDKVYISPNLKSSFTLIEGTEYKLAE